MSDHLLEAARESAGDAQAALGVALAAGARLAGADAATTLETLAALAEVDLSVARVVEPHLDALIIHAEAGLTAAPGTWGVFAAEAPGVELRALPSGDGWLL